MRRMYCGLLALCLTSALEVPVPVAVARWAVRSGSGSATRVALLEETDASAARALWPVAASMEGFLADFDGEASAIVCCLPFATGRECRTFGLRRYERDGGGRWVIGSAATAATCRAAAAALRENEKKDAVALRCAEVAVESTDGGRALAGFASDPCSIERDAAEVAAALGVPVAFAATTPAGLTLVEVADGDLDAATRPAGGEEILATAAAAGGGAFRSRHLRSPREGDDSDDGVTRSAAALGLFWAARTGRAVGESIDVAHATASGSAVDLALSLASPPKPKFGGRKLKRRLPTLGITFR